MKRKEVLTQIMILLLTLVFTVQFTGVFSVAFAIEGGTQTKEITEIKTVTITKIWADDKESIRPNFGDVVMHIKSEDSYLIPGRELADKIKELSDDNYEGDHYSDNNTVTAIKHATKALYEIVKADLTSDNEVQSAGAKTYMWFDNGTVYYYSEAATIYMNENSERAFCKLEELTDISGLADFDTSYVTDMNRMFQNCKSLSDLSPISGWNTKYVRDLTFTFGYTINAGEQFADNNIKMSINSFEALRNWDVSNVEEFNQTFKTCKDVPTLEPIAGWDVSRATNFNQMFNWCLGLNDTTRDYINGWDVKSVGNFNMMFANNGTITSPVFTFRPGTWTGNGNYNPNTSAQTPAPHDEPDIPDHWDNEYLSTDSSVCGITDNGDGTWTYTFTAPASNDGVTWSVWETTNDGTHIADAGGRADGYTESSDGTDGLGGSEASAITGVTDSATITNTYNYTDITVYKQWDDGSKTHTEQEIKDLFKFYQNDVDSTSTYAIGVTLDDEGSDKWSYTVSGLPKKDTSGNDYTYNVKEPTQPTGYSVTYERGASASDGETITNTLLKYDLTVSKKVTGNTADKTKAFDFTFTTDASGTFDYKIIDGADENTGSISSGDTLSLKDGESIEVIGIPYGSAYGISEADYSSDGYTTSTAGDAASGTMDADKNITFTNQKNGVVPTGRIGKLAQWLVMAAVSLMGLIAYLIMLIRRLRYSEEL